MDVSCKPERGAGDDDRYARRRRVVERETAKEERSERKPQAHRRGMATAERWVPALMLFTALGTCMRRRRACPCACLCVPVSASLCRTPSSEMYNVLMSYNIIIIVSCVQRRRRFLDETTTAGITRTFGVVKGEPSSAAVAGGATSITGT